MKCCYVLELKLFQENFDVTIVVLIIQPLEL